MVSPVLKMTLNQIVALTWKNVGENVVTMNSAFLFSMFSVSIHSVSNVPSFLKFVSMKTHFLLILQPEQLYHKRLSGEAI